MKQAALIIVVALLASCATESAVVTIADQYVDVNGQRLFDLENLPSTLDRFPKRKRITLSAHACTDSDRFLKVMEKIGAMGFLDIFITQHGELSDDVCQHDSKPL